MSDGNQMNYKRAFIENSKIFITMVTSKRRPILIENIEILRNAFKCVKDKIKFNIDATVILPDHLHLIIEPRNVEEYPEIIKGIKTYFSRNIDESKIEDYKLTKSREGKKEKDVWQRRYWEHSITKEEDLRRHIDYIHYNPVKHRLANTPKEWKYSSFKKYVKDGYYDEHWYNMKDEYDIRLMELE